MVVDINCCLQVLAHSCPKLKENRQCTEPHYLLRLRLRLHPVHPCTGLDLKVESLMLFFLCWSCREDGSWFFLLGVNWLHARIRLHIHIYNILQMNKREALRRRLGVLEQEFGQVQHAEFCLKFTLKQNIDRLRLLPQIALRQLLTEVWKLDFNSVHYKLHGFDLLITCLDKFDFIQILVWSHHLYCSLVQRLLAVEFWLPIQSMSQLID